VPHGELVEHVRITPCQICDNKIGIQQVSKDLLYDKPGLSDVISADARETDRRCKGLTDGSREHVGATPSRAIQFSDWGDEEDARMIILTHHRCLLSL
jgi:hypothetical protein